MRLVHGVLIGTTALLLSVFAHAAVGDDCTTDADCGSACCDDLGGTFKCAVLPRNTVIFGNGVVAGCECLQNDDPFQAATLSCGSCADSSDCDNGFCCDRTTSACSKFLPGSRANGQSAYFPCECESGLPYDSGLGICGVELACDPADDVCDDPHMQGLRGQHIDWSGVDGGWYSLVKDQDADVHVNIRLTAPMADEFPDRQLVTGLGIVSEGHSLTIEVKNPYAIDTDGCEGESPCLANGGLRALVDGDEVNSLLRFSRRRYVVGGIAVSASNLPVECRQFGGDKIWARMYEEMLEGTRTLLDETIEQWILKSRSMAAPDWCAKYIAENNLADLQSTHAIFKIETSAVTVRLNVGVNHQGGGQLDWDGRALPDLEFWQMDVGLDGLDIDNPSLFGILGETARPVLDDHGMEVMEGFEAFRGTVEDYRVPGALGTHFALLDNLGADHA